MATSRSLARSPDPASLPVPPRLVLAGLATLQREELSNFLAIFDQLSAWRLASDSIRDLHGRLPRQSPQPEPAFQRRVERAAHAHCRSGGSDAHLRLLVWIALRDGLGLSRLVPLAVATADRRGAELASQAARELGRNPIDRPSAPVHLALWHKAVAKVRTAFSVDQDPVEDAEASLRLMRDADVHAGAVREALGRLTRILAARPAAASGLRAIAAPVLQGAAGLASSGVDALRRASSKDR